MATNRERNKRKAGTGNLSNETFTRRGNAGGCKQNHTDEERTTLSKVAEPKSLMNSGNRLKPRKMNTARSINRDKSCEKRDRRSEGDPKNAINDELFRLIGKSLTQNQWYHGLMPRLDCEDLLKADGDFLVRKTTVSKIPTYCISVMQQGDARHIPVHFVNNNWTLKDSARPTLTELIDYLIESGKKVPPSNSVLKKSIPRPEYYILHDNVTTVKKIGAGAFGEVFLGTLKRKNKQEEDEEVKVAVKKLKGAVTKGHLGEFVKEAKLMRRFDHPNIVRMYGIAPQEEPVMIILEMAEGGSLKGYCEKNPDVTEDQLMTWAADGARGMCYLAGRQVIHRDLAARNCLLGKNRELKISDFGLSIADQSQVKLDKLKSMPIKWLAPETLAKGVFSTKTDVWTFGVLLWELYTRCKTDPFPGENNQQARVKILSGKDPMEPPHGTPPAGVEAMKLCFTQDPANRPDFAGVFKIFAPHEEPPQPMMPWETFID